MQNRLPHHQLVLIGLGHTNAHILRMWRMSPIPDAQLICISDFPYATYSGMLPGMLAGQYTAEQMRIDLVRACSASRARLILSPLQGIDFGKREINFVDRPTVRYDYLSIGIGSVPSFADVEIQSQRVLAIKPMQTFVSRLDAATDDAVAHKAKRASTSPLTVTIVGGGAGGVEIGMCLPAHLKHRLSKFGCQIRLVHGGDRLGNSVTSRTDAAIRHALEKNGVEVLLNERVIRIADVPQQAGALIQLQSGKQLETDLVLWATGAVASEQLRAFDLPHDEQGFLLTRQTLQSTGSDRVFVVGDSGTMIEQTTAKAGVFAVRQGKILWENLQRSVNKKPLIKYEPQQDFLKLLNTGNGRGIGQYFGQTFTGKWVFWLKDRIDRRFMEMHQDYTPAMMPAMTGDEMLEMRCQGCGGKVGGATLSNLFQRLHVKQNDSVLMGLDQPDDAALIHSRNGAPLAISTDFFSSPLDDPYIVGRVAALNSTSDIFATGANPTVALTMASVPTGHPREQEQLLYEVLAGSLHEFDQMNVSLVGGHTIEAEQLTIGFTVVGEQIGDRAKKKGDLQTGDQLIMTQRLGIGILLAAHMQARCRWQWFQPLIDTMLKNNGIAMQLITEFPTTAVTDITGFGLAGHLYEMLKASGKSAEISLSQLALLPGVEQLVQEGIESTLAPNNRWIEPLISADEKVKTSPSYAALFDPQTNGGMLIAIGPADVDACLKKLRAAGFEDAVTIGHIVEKADYEFRVI